ncbi:MAG: endonuclease/exonuclease/phosphatase family protein [Myxococcales bacterium]
MAKPFRLLSYNVRYFGHALRGIASTRGGKRGIASCIAAMEPLPHILCMQEVETYSLRSTLAFRRSHPEETQLESFMAELERAFNERGRSFPYEAFYFRAHANRLGNTPLSSMGLAIVVDTTALRVERHNAEAPQFITHHHVLRWKDKKQARICAHMRVADAAGRPLHVFNTHLSLPTPFAKQFWTGPDKMGFGVNQLHEARTLANFIGRQAGNEPFIVCGDFNSPPSSPVYRYLTEEAGLVGVQQTLGQIEGAPREFPTAGFLSLRMHLDHLFSSPHVKWVDLDGTRPYGDRASPFHGKSDHVPLIARFVIGE